MDDEEFAELVAGRSHAALPRILGYLEEVASTQSARNPGDLNNIGALWNTGALWLLVNRSTTVPVVIARTNGNLASKGRHTTSIIAADSDHDEIEVGLVDAGVDASEIYCTKQDYSEADEIAGIASLERVRYVISNPYHFNQTWTEAVITGLQRRLKDLSEAREDRQLNLWVVEPEDMTSTEIVSSLQTMAHEANADMRFCAFLISTVEHLIHAPTLLRAAEADDGWSVGIVSNGLASAIHQNDTKQIKENIQIVQHNIGKSETWQVLDNSVDLLRGMRTFDSLPRG